MRRHTVPDSVSPMPLKTYLSRAFPRLPGWLIRETLKKKDVRVNGTRSGADAQVRGGDELILYAFDDYLDAPPVILYEDDELLVAEKPAGLPVDSDQDGVGADTMISRLTAYCPTARLCHRLDTGTGGVLICAKTEKAWRDATDAFRRHEMVKKYRCLVAGVPERSEAALTGFLIKDARQARVRVVDSPRPGALPIETGYRLLDSKNGVSLLEVTLITGRTHQIRAHLASVSLPLLGDDKYGDRAANRRAGKNQPALWCVRIDWKGLSFSSEAPFRL